MEGYPEFSSAQPRPLTTVQSFQQYPQSTQLQPGTTYLIQQPEMGVLGQTPLYYPPNVPPLPHHLIPPPLTHNPPRFSGPVFPAPASLDGTYRLGHTIAGPPQSTMSWITHSHPPPIFPFPPPMPPPLSHDPPSSTTLRPRPAPSPNPTIIHHVSMQPEYFHLLQPQMPPAGVALQQPAYHQLQSIPQQHYAESYQLMPSQLWLSHPQHSHQSAFSPPIIRPVATYRAPPEESMDPDPSQSEQPGASTSSVLQMPYVLPGPEPSTQSPTPITPPASTPQEEAQEILSGPPISLVEEYREFAIAFQRHRVKLGYTTLDVSQQLGIRYGVTYKEHVIIQFEELRLPLANVKKLKPVLEMWVKDTAKAAGSSEEEINQIVVAPSTGINPRRERKRRTAITDYTREELEEEFRKKRKPTQAEMSKLSNKLGVEKDFVRVWFCNRRQRQKRKEGRPGAAGMGQSSSQATGEPVTIPSPSHDITVEVPEPIEVFQEVYVTEAPSRSSYMY